jgi:cytochrome c biogenesis protein CcmG/thiol:disulfide interchange protein DsbE
VSARALFAFLAVCAVVALLAFGLLSKGSSQLEPGDPVPDRSLPVLGGGGTETIAEHRGEWVLVNLWASWCGPCRHEAPVLESFYRRNRDRGVTVIGINVQDNEDDALAFVREFDPTYPQLRSVGDERSEAFGAGGVPENFLVDPRGKIAVVWPAPVDGRILSEQFQPVIEGRG